MGKFDPRNLKSTRGMGMTTIAGRMWQGLCEKLKKGYRGASHCGSCELERILMRD